MTDRRTNSRRDRYGTLICKFRGQKELYTSGSYIVIESYPQKMYNHIKAEAHDVVLVARTGVESLNFPTLCLGLYFGRMVRRGYRFSAFSYAKPSDFRRNFRPTRIEVTKIFVGL